MGIMPDAVQDSDNLFNTSALLTKWVLVPSISIHSPNVLSPSFWGTGCHPRCQARNKVNAYSFRHKR